MTDATGCEGFMITNTLPILNHPLSIARRLSKEGNTLSGWSPGFDQCDVGKDRNCHTKRKNSGTQERRKFISHYSREMNIRYIPEDQQEFPVLNFYDV